MQACDRCHARKTRCDRRIPRCSACEKASAPCLHVDKLRSRNLPRGYVESIEKDLQKVERENVELKRQMAALRSQASSFEGYANSSQNPSPTTTTTTTTTAAAGAETGNSDRPSWVNQTPVEDTGTAGPSASAGSVRTSTDDAVAVEVGYLTLTATGESRYLGSSSGMGLASIINSVLDPQSLRPQQSDSYMDERHPQFTSTAGDSPFPPRSVAMQLIKAYFHHTHITFPLLHRPTFLAAVEQIYNNPNYYAMHPFDAFAFDMVLSIGSSNFNRFDESVAGTTTHYARAQSKLHSVLNMDGLVPLQAILLLSHHGIFSNLRDTSASIWHLIGIGARTCFELGLHLEPKRVKRPSGQPVDTMSSVSFEVEMRKRTFWCFYNLDRVVSFTLGRPVALRDEDIGLSLPLALEDEEFGPDQPIPPTSYSDPTRISPFLHVIRIRNLSGRILSTLYAAKQRSDITLVEKQRVRRQFYEETMAWKEATRLLKLEDRIHDGQASVSCFLSSEWYDAVVNNALLLLYRPSPYLPYPVAPNNAGAEQGDLHRLFYAAKSSIMSYYELHRKRRLNYSWITLHGVFIAGLAYVYGIGLALKEPSQGMAIPDHLDIISDTRACSNILVAICERWSVARSSCELFNRLSIAVIRDAINASSNRDPAPSRGTASYQGMSAGQSIFSLSNGQEGLQCSQHADGGRGSYDLSSPMAAGDTAPAAGSDQFDHMFVIDEFRHHSSGLDYSYFANEPQPSELISGFSQEWPFDDAFAASLSDAGFRGPTSGLNGSW